MKTKYIVILLIIIVLLGTGIYFGYSQYKKAMKYCYNYNIKKSKVTKVSANDLSIDFAIDFKNNSDIEAQIDGYKFDIKINGVTVSQVSSNKQERIKANDFTTIIVPIKVNPKSLLDKKLINAETIKNIIMDKSKIVITTEGFVSGGALGVKVKDMPVSIPYTLAEMLAPSTEPVIQCK